jgi:hypothetical protein
VEEAIIPRENHLPPASYYPIWSNEHDKVVHRVHRTHNP